MIHLILPCGSNFGWGICGKYLVKELCDLCETALITENFDAGSIGDELEYHFLKSKLDHMQKKNQTNRLSLQIKLPTPLIWPSSAAAEPVNTS